MKDVIDIAAYILNKLGDMSTMKLQKLSFYSHAYSLVTRHVPLFENTIEAWANGPVMPDLFEAHRHKYVVNLDSMDFKRDPLPLDAGEQKCVDKVIETIGMLSGSQLSSLTHSEKPWKEARAGLESCARSRMPITNQAIFDFYSSSVTGNPVFKGL